MWSVLLIWLEFHRSWQKHGATHGKTVLFSVKQGVGGGGGLDFLHGQVWPGVVGSGSTVSTS